MTEPDDQSQPDEDYPDFSLVRPYVASITDPPPAGRHGGRVLPAHDRPTELIPIHSPAAAGSGHREAEPPAAVVSYASPMSTRFKVTITAAAAVVLIGTAGGVYALSSDGGPVNFGSGAPAVLPALQTSGASPTPSVTLSPSAVHSTKAAATSNAGPASPSPGSSATAKLIAPAPSTSSGHPFGPGQGNLAAGRPVTCSGHSDVYVPSNAVDGNPNTYWESTNWQDSHQRHPQWLTVDLGQSVTIGRIVLAVPQQAAWIARTQTISIFGSGGGHFATIVGTADYRFDPATGNTVTISVRPTTSRYVQLVFTANTAWPAGQISEIEIFAA